ncbi:MAG: DNA alkylation repair protein [Thermoplasmata archaeon]|nr:DNA alkylation repair protein [Thermoplasmata archaeon]
MDPFPTKNDIPRTGFSSVRKGTERLVDLVRKNASPEDAPHAQKYIKTNLELLGVRMPILDSIAKEFFDLHKKDGDLSEVHRTAGELWAVPIYDVKTLAISILRRFRRKLDVSTFDVVKAWWDDIDNWAHCDGMSVYVLGSILLKDDSVISEIMEWTKSDNFWRRRAALTSTMLGNRAGKGDPFWTLTMLNDVLDDDEYYVRKVYGWVLREMGKGYPDFVFEYMMFNKSKFNKTDVKEAVKHLPEDQAKTVMETDFSL